MQIIDTASTTAGLPFGQLIPAVQAMFAAGCQVPLRHTHKVGDAQSGQGTWLLMPAWQTGGRMGIKTVSIYPDNQQRGLPGLHSVFVLFDATSGVPLAMLDGNVITSRRTAAASALAARYLSRVDAKSLLVLGAGRVASLLPEAYRTVRPIESVQVWDVHAGMANALVAQLRRDGLRAEVVTDLQTAVANADIVSCATLSTVPRVLGAWLRPGTHLDLIGSFTPQMRESDAECFRVASVFVDTEEAPMKSGDILEAVACGAFRPESIAADLTALCRGQHPGRRSPGEITLFKAVGTALEDLAAASLAYDLQDPAPSGSI